MSTKQLIISVPAGPKPPYLRECADTAAAQMGGVVMGAPRHSTVVVRDEDWDAWEFDVRIPEMVTFDATRLTWDGRVPTAAELTDYIESMPAGEFATGLLVIADALREREQA